MSQLWQLIMASLGLQDPRSPGSPTLLPHSHFPLLVPPCLIVRVIHGPRVVSSARFSLSIHSLSESTQLYNFKHYLYMDVLANLSNLDFSLKLQAHLSNCLFSISTWVSDWHFTLVCPKLSSWSSIPKPGPLNKWQLHTSRSSRQNLSHPLPVSFLPCLRPAVNPTSCNFKIIPEMDLSIKRQCRNKS